MKRIWAVAKRVCSNDRMKSSWKVTRPLLQQGSNQCLARKPSRKPKTHHFPKIQMVPHLMWTKCQNFNSFHNESQNMSLFGEAGVIYFQRTPIAYEKNFNDWHDRPSSPTTVETSLSISSSSTKKISCRTHHRPIDPSSPRLPLLHHWLRHHQGSGLPALQLTYPSRRAN